MHTNILNKKHTSIYAIQYRHKLQKQISTEQKQAKIKDTQCRSKYLSIYRYLFFPIFGIEFGQLDHHLLATYVQSSLDDRQ